MVARREVRIPYSQLGASHELPLSKYEKILELKGLHDRWSIPSLCVVTAYMHFLVFLGDLTIARHSVLVAQNHSTFVISYIHGKDI